ncbi:DUF3784 domain-containing protein [Croceimicrobium hydrocarbonivorans]|uniref:DUF3784 domain-containing protein n=1 Tax=Croceimicrobium hydrocarbonivorans TaxID=2761580 RepID=A0A7H0VHZ4_9FLAO|nr:DUF3784 domain-containing protein [Croceimicrobium hydrocarbonivorans]QNR25342.1 DUF3784 domain-containing protein [Croceimicrobium hydrocarbonivorans]
MLYLIIGMSLLFLVLAFAVNTNNARYLLSGYNTMTEEERANFDLKGFLKQFKSFHIFLGLSFGIFGVLLFFQWGQNVVGWFLGLFPILAYLVFIIRARRYDHNPPRYSYWAIGALLVCIIGVSTLLIYGDQNIDFVVQDQKVHISGMYGADFEIDDIESIRLVDELPPITSKVNGFAMAPVFKGYFRTKAGDRVKLLVLSKASPLLYIQLKNGEELYYVPEDRSAEKEFEQIAIGRISNST